WGVTLRLEHPVALQVDDLLGLRDREADRILLARMRIGTDEAVLLHAVGTILLDGPRGLVESARFEGGRANTIALVFNGGRGHHLGFAGSGEALPGFFELGEHVPLSPALRRMSTATNVTEREEARMPQPTAIDPCHVAITEPVRDSAIPVQLIYVGMID